MRAHRGGYDERVELPGRSRDDLADDLRDLRVMRHPSQATKHEHIAADEEHAELPGAAATTTTSRRPARQASPAPSDRTRAHRGGHEEHAVLPESSRRDDIARIVCRSHRATKREHIPHSGHDTRTEFCYNSTIVYFLL